MIVLALFAVLLAVIFGVSWRKEYHLHQDTAYQLQVKEMRRDELRGQLEEARAKLSEWGIDRLKNAKPNFYREPEAERPANDKEKFID